MIRNSRNIEVGTEVNNNPSENSFSASGNTKAYKDNRACACCGAYTIPYNSELFICPICGWIDDVFQNSHPDSTDGPNAYSLQEMREKIRNRLI